MMMKESSRLIAIAEWNKKLIVFKKHLDFNVFVLRECYSTFGEFGVIGMYKLNT